MPHYYAASGTPVELDESPDDVGVRFGHEDGAATARTAFRRLVPARPKARAAALPAKRFGRFMLLHDAGASTAPVETVVNAFSPRLASRVARTLPVFVERISKLKLVATEQILVSFRPKAAAAARRKLLDGLELQLIGTSEFDARRHVVVPKSVRRAARSLDLANQLAEADDLVAFAAPNFLAELRKTQPPVDDPMFAAQWHLHNTGRNGARAEQDVRAIGAWQLAGGGSESIVIAIIDDGIDLDHPDLAAHIWSNPARGARDRHGRDFVDDTDPFNPRPKVFIPPFDNTDTNDIHGTPCAGVAAAVGNNGKGVCGIAWNCRLMAVKIMAGPSLAPNDRIADAIRYASQHADVLSCSWGVARHPDIESAIQFAVTRGRRGRGAAVFAATGNEEAPRIGFPSSDERAIAVGACNDRGVRSAYSNFGRGIDLVAPSGDDHRPGITTTDVSARGKGYSGGAYADDFSGTSSATPLAAGTAALVLSAHSGLRWDEVRDVLTSTADKIDAARGAYRSGYSLRYGFGRVNAEAAVQEARKRKSRRRRAGRKR
jgi:subtilisin family serine protease